MLKAVSESVNNDSQKSDKLWSYLVSQALQWMEIIKECGFQKYKE